MDTEEMVGMFMCEPTKDNFDYIFSQHGYLAFSLIYSKMKDKRDFMNYFNLYNLKETNWEMIYYGSFGEFKIAAISKMNQFEHSILEWVSFYFIRKDELKKLSLTKITSKDATFEEWISIFNSLKRHQERTPVSEKELEEIKSLILSKMSKKALSFLDWEFICREANGDLRENAFQKLKELV